MSPEELWASKYAAPFAQEKSDEEARREQAFLDLPTSLCGEEIRAMTPMDLLVLNGANNAFVCAGKPSAHDVMVFLWWLNITNDHSDSFWNGRRRLKVAWRVDRLPFFDCVDAIFSHVDSLFQDSPAGRELSGERRPLGVCFLAGLLSSLAADMGPIDPVDGKPLAHCPLPRLFQYAKARTATKLGKDFVDFSPSDRLTGEWLSELNSINNAAVGAN